MSVKFPNMHTGSSNSNHKTGCGYPLGTYTVSGGVQFTAHIPFKHTLELIIYNGSGDAADHVNMADHTVSEGTYSVIIEEPLPRDWSYVYEADGAVVPDPFMMNSTAARKFGDDKAAPDRARLYQDDYDWEDDVLPALAYNEIVAYQLHVRGFTADPSSRVNNRGRFSGIAEKIPYLTGLGVNQLVLMPCYEFDEIIRPKKNGAVDVSDYKRDNGSVARRRVNFWGFTDGCYFMPKASYSNGDPTAEFKDMVKALHAARIEVIMRFYFPASYNKAFIPDILRFWARQYHVDGFFLMGEDIPMDMIAADVYLRDRKIYNNFFDKDSLLRKDYGCNPNMAIVNSDFMNVCRKYLKSDENQLSDFLFRQRLNPHDVHTVNFITDYYGFTLNDLVTYDYKHNEDNDEDNADGENFNYSWNCGVEGPSRKKAIMALRTRQIKNALVFLLMAQGTPMICAGDEFLDTRGGNNNPYCQDNETGWVVWKNNRQSAEIYDYTKMLIALRREHPVLHPDREFRIMDYAACGFPDLSYHSDLAWNPKFDNHLRHIGLMICGKYARLTRTREDDFFYFAYNMHWEDHSFALPKLPKGLAWQVCFVTCSESSAAVIYESLSGKGETVTVPDRTVAVLRSVQGKLSDDTNK